MDGAGPPSPSVEEDWSPFPPLVEGSHLCEWSHDEVLGVPIIKDRGRSEGLSVGCQRTWEERSWGPEKQLPRVDTPGAGPREADRQ